MTDTRLQSARAWLETLGLAVEAMTPASEDASFRRYFRVHLASGESRILMDAPPDKEPLGPFLDIAARLAAVGVHVPEVYASAPEAGFVLLEDLGATCYLEALDEDRVERLYGDALGALAAIQCLADTEGLPPYDATRLQAEMSLFPEWLLTRHLGMTLTPAQHDLLERTRARLVEAALAQPRVFVHRDYHSRNLMVVPAHNPGILDFQDAVAGPVTYDLVSLLRDCYVAWPEDRVRDWALGYLQLAEQTGVLRAKAVDEDTFLRWFDWMGVQRHLKAAGIFARLWHRDGKPGYLADVPRTLGYVVAVCRRHPELAPFGRFVAEEVLPRLEARADTA
ncbi:MAG: aminoglycoside phosphotransferase [Gammaproteobacteria bacterium]|nr:MAG: aminoglycoside phosphotransferase [Gammaproteobacteria bacterium]